MVECPLCQKSNTTLLEKIQTKDLISGYYKILKSNIAEEFHEHNEIGFYNCLSCDLRFFSPMVPGSEKFYKLFQVFDWYYMDDKSEYQYAAGFINESNDVLEIGAGKGAFAKKISAKCYTGLELSTQAKIIAAQNGIEIKNELIEEHAVNNKEKYDIVCSFQVLEHVSNLYSFINSSLACLKPDGLLIYSVPCADSYLSLVENGLLNMPPHHMTWWSYNTLSNLAHIYNLEIYSYKHDKLEDHHVKEYASTISLRAIKSILHINYNFLNLSLSNRILIKIASLMGRIYEKGLNDKNARSNGHSITVVYKKRDNG